MSALISTEQARIERLENIVGLLAAWLYQAQTGLSKGDHENIERMLRVSEDRHPFGRAETRADGVTPVRQRRRAYDVTKALTLDEVARACREARDLLADFEAMQTKPSDPNVRTFTARMVALARILDPGCAERLERRAAQPADGAS